VHFPLPLAAREPPPPQLGTAVPEQPQLPQQAAQASPNASMHGHLLQRRCETLSRDKARGRRFVAPAARSSARPPSLRDAARPAHRPQEELQAAYEQLQRNSSRETAKLRGQCESLAHELQQHADEVTALRAQLMSKGTEAKQVDRLRSKLQRLEQHSAAERTALQRGLDKHKKEVPTAHAPGLALPRAARPLGLSAPRA
jgi:chromosome segregation ATPase